MRSALIVVLMVAAVSASSLQKRSTEDDVLGLLQRILNIKNEKRGWCENNPGKWDCHGGRCGGGEDPHGLGYYCFKCPDKSGGWQCEIPDPCANNPCASRKDGKTGCRHHSMFKVGYYCKYARRSTARDDLLEQLENNADSSDMREIRELMLQTGDVDEAIVEGLKRQVSTKRSCE